jgi:glycosyltransferase involved in cell wall biosynthesis
MKEEIHRVCRRDCVIHLAVPHSSSSNGFHGFGGCNLDLDFKLQRIREMRTKLRQNSSRAARVLHVVPALFGSKGGIVGGAERYAMELARHMSVETPTVLVSFGERDYQETKGLLTIRVIGSPWYVGAQLTNPVSLSLIKEVRHADVVHCHQQHVLSSSLAAFVGRLIRKRVFVSDLGGGGWDVSSYVSTDRWYRGHLHISQYSRKVSGHAGKRRAHVIYGGVDTTKFSPNDSVTRNGKALFVGRLLPHKGVDDLIRALPPEMSLEVIGQPYDQRFVDDLKSLASNKRVTMRHECDDGALVQAYREAMCVVLPSVYKDAYGQETKVPELLGQTLLEGMACGAPVICTNVASMPEVVDDGVSGFVVPPNDPAALNQKLNWLREHPIEARAMGEAGRRRVLEKFTWPMVVRKCLDIYSLNA